MAKAKTSKVMITQVRSAIKRPQNQVRTIEALGLGKINRSVEKELTPQIAGMINKVKHLIEVKEL
jgi:large subunit ribosomal protein L30